MIAFDGAMMVGPVINLPVILDNLYSARAIPPLLTVMVGAPEPGPPARLTELACNPLFVSFVADELVTWIRSSAAGLEPARTIAAGMSFGGLGAGFCGVSRPDLFQSVLSVAGSFWWGPEGERPEWLVGQVRKAFQVADCWYPEAGTFDTSTEAPSDVLRSNRALRDALASKGAELGYAEFSGGHDAICCGTSLANGLIALTKDW